MISEALRKALKQMDNAADNLSIAYADHSQPGEEQNRLRAACLLLRQLKNAVENGEAYSVSGRAEEFDHANRK